MSEADLHQRIAALEVENHILRAENKKLREALGLSSEDSSLEQAMVVTPKVTVTPEIISSINKFSSPEEKIELYMSLFRGRTDVYAKRCYSKKYGSSYYIPACKNEWVRDVCDKVRTKCKNCDKRELLPLTAEVIDSHLRNKDPNGAGIVGIYPLLPDDTCLFLAIDFDEEKWEKDVAIFRSVCQDSTIPVAIERSRSGNGAHAWFFFEEPVPAMAHMRGFSLKNPFRQHPHENWEMRF